MNMPDIRRYEMLLRVKEFGVAHADVFPASTVGGSLFAAVASTVDKVTQCGVTQTHRGAAGDRSSTKTITKDALRASLFRISHTARAMAPGTPGLDGKFVMPKSQSDQRVLLAARAFLADATPLRDAFVTHHLPPAFLGDLSTAIDVFEHAIQADTDLRESRAAARAGISDALDAGMSTVARLDTLVTNALGHQQDVLAEWRSARHVSRVSIPYPNRKHPTVPAPAPAPVPVTKAA